MSYLERKKNVFFFSLKKSAPLLCRSNFDKSSFLVYLLVANSSSSLPDLAEWMSCSPRASSSGVRRRFLATEIFNLVLFFDFCHCVLLKNELAFAQMTFNRIFFFKNSIVLFAFLFFCFQNQPGF